MRALIDYADKPYARRARRHRRVIRRVFQLSVAGLFVWSAWSLVISIVHYNEARVVALETAKEK